MRKTKVELCHYIKINFVRSRTCILLILICMFLWPKLSFFMNYLPKYVVLITVKKFWCLSASSMFMSLSGFLDTLKKIVNMFYFHFHPQKFIEEKEFLAQLETSFQKCEEIHNNLGKAVFSFWWNDHHLKITFHLFHFPYVS